MKQKTKKSRFKLVTVDTKKSLIEMLKLSMRITDELMTLMDMTQTVGIEELFTKVK